MNGFTGPHSANYVEMSRRSDARSFKLLKDLNIKSKKYKSVLMK